VLVLPPIEPVPGLPMNGPLSRRGPLPANGLGAKDEHSRDRREGHRPSEKAQIHSVLSLTIGG